jgi:hypothetical protein
MLHPSTQKLIDRLAEMTALKQIDWAEADDQGGVVYATEGYAVTLAGDPVHVDLSTDSGRLLEEATSNTLKETPHEEHGDYSEVIRIISREAGRIARGTEAAIDALLDGLGQKAGNSRRNKQQQPSVRGGDDTSTGPAEAVPVADASLPETAFIEPDEPSNEISFDEEDVGGAVARLADEVNGIQRAPDETLRRDLPAFSVTPNNAPPMPSARQGDEIADSSSGPIGTEDTDTGTGEVRDTAGPWNETQRRQPGAPFSRYVPFGLSGAQPVGADVSADNPSVADLDSQLGAASAGMTTPVGDEIGSPPMNRPLSLKGSGAAAGFDEAGWRPHSSNSYGYGDGDDADEAVIVPRPVIDATGDEDTRDVEPSGNRPDFDSRSKPSEAGIDAVLPPASDDAEEDLFEESEEPRKTKSDDEKTGGKSARRPKRKTRFNPWS